MLPNEGRMLVLTVVVSLLFGCGAASSNITIPCEANGVMKTLTFNSSNASYLLNNCEQPLLHILVAAENVSIRLTNVSIAALTVSGATPNNGTNSTQLGNVLVDISASTLNACVGVITWANMSNHSSNVTNYFASSLQISSDAAISAQVRVSQTSIMSCNASAVNMSIRNFSYGPSSSSTNVTNEGSNTSSSSSSTTGSTATTVVAMTNSTLTSSFYLLQWWLANDRNNFSVVPVVAAVVTINSNRYNAHVGVSEVTFRFSTLTLNSGNVEGETLPATYMASKRRPAVHVVALGTLDHGSRVLVNDSALLVRATNTQALQLMKALLAPSNNSLASQASCISVGGTTYPWPVEDNIAALSDVQLHRVSCSGGQLFGYGLSIGDGNTTGTSSSSSSLNINMVGGVYNDMCGGSVIVCLHVVCLRNSSITLSNLHAVWTKDTSTAANGSVSSTVVSTMSGTHTSLSNLSISITCSEFFTLLDDIVQWTNSTLPQRAYALIAIPAGSTMINLTLENTRVVTTAYRSRSTFSTLLSSDNIIALPPMNASEWFPTIMFYAIYVDGSTTQLHVQMRTCRLELPLLQSTWSIIIEAGGNESTFVVVGTGRRVFSQAIYAPVNVTITTDEWHNQYFGAAASSVPPPVLVAECVYLHLLDDVFQSPNTRVDSGALSNLGEHLPALWRSANTATVEATPSKTLPTKSHSSTIEVSQSKSTVSSQSEQLVVTNSSSQSLSKSTTAIVSRSASLSSTPTLAIPNTTTEAPTTTQPPTTSLPATTTSTGAPLTTAPGTTTSPAPTNTASTQAPTTMATTTSPASPVATTATPAPPMANAVSFARLIRRPIVLATANGEATTIFVEFSVSRPRNGMTCSRARDGDCAGAFTHSLSASDTRSSSLTPSATLSPSMSVSPSRSSTHRTMTSSRSISTFKDNVSASIVGHLSALDLLTEPASLLLLLNGTWFPHWAPSDNCTHISFYPTSFNFSLGLGDANGLNDRISPVGFAAALYIAQNSTLRTETSLLGELQVPPNSDVFRNIVDDDVTVWFFLDSRCTARGDKTLVFNITIDRIQPFTFQVEGREYQIMQDISQAIAVLSLAAALPVLALDVARVTAPLTILRCTAEGGVPLRHYQSFVSWQLIIDNSNPNDVQLSYYYGTIAIIGIVWIGLLTVHMMFVALFKVVTATTLLKGCIDGRFPSLLLAPFFALLQPMAMSVTTVVQDGAVSGSLWVGVAGGVLCFAACVAVTLRHVCCFSPISNEGALQHHRSFVMRMILGSSVWNDHPDEEILCYTKRHYGWFGSLKGTWHWVFLAEMWMSILLGVLEGIHLGESNCIPLVWVAGALFLLRMLFHAGARPYDAPFWTLGIVLLSATEALLCATIIAYDWIDIADQSTRRTIQEVGEWDMRVSVYLLIVSCGLGVVKLLLAQFVDTAEAEYHAARAIKNAAIPQLGSLSHDTAEVLRLVDDICDEIAEHTDAYDPSLHKAFVSAHLELMLPGCEEDAEKNLLEILREFDVAALESGNKKLFTSTMEQLFERLVIKYSSSGDPAMLREGHQSSPAVTAHRPQESAAVLRSPDHKLHAAMQYGSPHPRSPNGNEVDTAEIELQEFSPTSSPVRPLSLPRRGSTVEREQLNRNGLSYDQRQQFLDEMLNDTSRSLQNNGVEL